jgi:mycothiol system anti-sigma-R factor
MKDDCKRAIAQAYQFLDGEGLSSEERAEIQRHLQECAPCYERVGLDEEVMNIISRMKGTTRCPQELKSRIEALLDS